MKCLCYNFTLILFSFLLISKASQAQELKSTSAQNRPADKFIILGQSNYVEVSENEFRYAEDENGDFINNHAITTFHAKHDFIEIYFTTFNIPEGAEIRIYNGKTNHDGLFGVFRKGDKIWNVASADITIEYMPSPENIYIKSAGHHEFTGFIRTIPFSDPQTKALLPESDCPGAIPLCQNLTVVALGGHYTNLGAVNDDGGSCYSGTGSGGSVWYSFKPTTNGPLDFTITPAGTTDYDFVVWDITNGCGSGQRVEVSCNYSLYTGITGLSTAYCSEMVGTCTTNDCSTDSKAADCNRFNRRINVLSTHKYAICVNFYSGSNDGFNLTFKLEPGSVNITDNTPPFITNSLANACGGASSLHLLFNEWVDCSTIQNGDFTLAGYTFTVSNNYCINGRTNQVDLSVAPPLPLGTYSIHAQDILDFCGNNMNSNYTVVLGAAPVANAGPDKVICKSPGFLGIGWNYTPSSQSLTASAGTSYLWSDGQSAATISVSPTVTTTYIVTVANGACTATDATVVYVDLSPTPNLGPDQTICALFPINLTASGGNTYQWQSTTSTFFGTPTGWTNIPGATLPSYTGYPASTIYYQVLVTSANGCTGSDWIKVNVGSGSFSATANPPVICAGSVSTLSVPGSISSYFWSGGPTNTPWVVAPSANTVYTVTSSTSGCTGVATVSVNVSPLPAVTATVSNSNICIGDVITLNSTPSPASSSITENFEGTSNIFTILNGSNNKWYQGTAAFASGAKGLYIGTAATNNNYIISNLGIVPISAVNFAYKDFTFASYCNSNVSFKWKCNGQQNQAELSVWLVPVTFTPVTGTAITVGGGNILIGGPYYGQTTYQTANINLTAYVGQTMRLVFQWMNKSYLSSGSVVANPAASIDDFSFNESTNYAYSWTSVPSGFSSNGQSTSVSPVVNTVYNFTATRCDGCQNTATASVAVSTCPLPVELINFSGNCQDGTKHLFWSTASETNNDFFTIERSMDAQSFEVAGTVDGAGNSNTVLNYSFVDNKAGSYYYRLKQTDFNGLQTWFNTIYPDCDEANSSALVNAYTTGNDVHILINGTQDAGFLINIYDDIGRLVVSSKGKLENTENEIVFNGAHFSDGIYLVSFFSDNQSVSMKFLLKKL
jgi:hypothetical protein